MSNPKHKGPHCDGCCEGVAYTLMIRDKDAEIEELKIVAGVRLAGMTALQAEIERLNARLATVQKQADVDGQD